jgi:hypothetical protein
LKATNYLTELQLASTFRICQKKSPVIFSAGASHFLANGLALILTLLQKAIDQHPMNLEGPNNVMCDGITLLLWVRLKLICVPLCHVLGRAQGEGTAIARFLFGGNSLSRSRNDQIPDAA